MKYIQIHIVTIVLILTFFSNESKSYDNQTVSIDPINGVYRTKIIDNNFYDNIFVICKNGKSLKVNFYQYSVEKKKTYSYENNYLEEDIFSTKKRTNFDSYEKQDFNFFNYYTISNNNTILAKEDPQNGKELGLKYYLKVEKNKIIGVMFQPNEEMVYQIIGEKILNEFKIINEESNNIVEICKSK